MDKTQAIEEKRSVTEQVKQEAKREEEKKEEEAKPPAAKKEDGKAAPAAKEEAKKDVKKEAKKEEKPKEKKPALERLATIPLGKVYTKSRSHRARIALSLVRAYAVRHAKAIAAKVRIEPAVNELIGADGARHPPRSVRVVIRKFDDGATTVALPAAVKK